MVLMMIMFFSLFPAHIWFGALCDLGVGIDSDCYDKLATTMFENLRLVCICVFV